MQYSGNENGQALTLDFVRKLLEQGIENGQQFDLEPYEDLQADCKCQLNPDSTGIEMMQASFRVTKFLYHFRKIDLNWFKCSARK